MITILSTQLVALFVSFKSYPYFEYFSNLSNFFSTITGVPYGIDMNVFGGFFVFPYFLVLFN